MKKKDKWDRKRHAKVVQKHVTEKLKAWHHRHKNDPDYRAKRAEGSRRHLEQVYRDAELGRMARVILSGMGELLGRLADLKRMADGAAIDKTLTETTKQGDQTR